MLRTAQNGYQSTDASERRSLQRMAKPQPHPRLHGYPVEAVMLPELRRRMALPQRHRLLHGYPLAAAMPSADDRERLDTFHFDPASGRGLLIGVLPHPCCNAALKGCGFCTFLHL